MNDLQFRIKGEVVVPIDVVLPVSAFDQIEGLQHITNIVEARVREIIREEAALRFDITNTHWEWRAS